VQLDVCRVRNVLKEVPSKKLSFVCHERVDRGDELNVRLGADEQGEALSHSVVGSDSDSDG
jgi:hypothetical protein